jgi:hypothetical protein
MDLVSLTENPAEKSPSQDGCQSGELNDDSYTNFRHTTNLLILSYTSIRLPSNANRSSSIDRTPYAYLSYHLRLQYDLHLLAWASPNNNEVEGPNTGDEG